MSRYGTTLLILCLASFCGSAQADVGDVWDATADFIGGLDQFEDPVEPWSYRCGEPGRGAYAEYLVWKDEPQWGAPPGFYTRGLEIEDRPILDDDPLWGADGIVEEELHGHGAYMLRWESPIDGWIQVTGYMYQSPVGTAGRVQKWQLLHNDVVLTQGYQPNDGEVVFRGYENRTKFDEGSGGLRATFLYVEEFDTVDIITPGSNAIMPNDTTPDPVSIRYVITEVDESDVPEITRWDARNDYVEFADQETDPPDPWSYRNGTGTPGDGTYGNLLVWRDLGQFGEFVPMYAPTDDLKIEEPPIVTNVKVFTAVDPQGEQLYGHGPWLLRWTSPINNWVKISGYVYQTEAAAAFRITNWQILHNDEVITAGLTGHNEQGPLNGYDHRVTYEEGSGGQHGTFINVQEGDTIDLITPGSAKFGISIPTTIGAKFTIEKVSAAQLPSRDAWDARLDFAGGRNQTDNPNLPWTYREGDGGGLLSWKSGGQLGEEDVYAAAADDTPPVIGGRALSGGDDVSNEQVGGIGNCMVRWESPLNGWVRVDGYAYSQEGEGSWKILNNGAVVTEGAANNGFANRVAFTAGSGGDAGKHIAVSQGDTVDYVTESAGAVNSKLSIIEVPASPSNLVATGLENAIRISWDAAPDTDNVTIVGYNIFENGVKVNEDPITATAQILFGRRSGEEACFTVEASGSNLRESGPTNQSCATPEQDEREVWDARADYVGGLDQAADPNLPWTYHNGEPGRRDYNLLVWRPEGQWGVTDIYTKTVDGEPDRPVLSGNPVFDLEDPDSEQISGHGAWLIRWTSPIDGLINISGYIYQGAGQCCPRLTNWKINKNGATYTQGFTAHDEFGALNGYENRVPFEEGTGGATRTFVNVAVGDTIDFLTPGSQKFGDSIPTSHGAKLVIRRADPSEIPAQSVWDVRNDFVGGLDQENEPHPSGWQYLSGEGSFEDPNSQYGNFLVWREDGQWGSPGPTYARSLNVEDRPMVSAPAYFSSQDPENEQFGSHGDWLIRWTSPIDGEVEIDGYIYQTDVAAANRLTDWAILVNDSLVTQGTVAHDDFGPLNGFDLRTGLDQGDGGPDALEIEVVPGDRIDFITSTNPLFGEAIPTTIGSKFTITQIGEGCVAVPEICDDGQDNDCDNDVDDADSDCDCVAVPEICDDGQDNDCDEAIDDADPDCEVDAGVGPFVRGDCDGNGTVGGSPTEAIVLLNYSFRGGAAPGCLAACDAEANGSIGVTDALRILRHAFLGIGEPDAPFPDCTKSEIGSDVELGCEVPVTCQ